MFLNRTHITHVTFIKELFKFLPITWSIDPADLRKILQTPPQATENWMAIAIFQMSNLKKSFQLSSPLDESNERYLGFSRATTFMIGSGKKIHINGMGFQRFRAQICSKCWISSRIAIFQKLILKNSFEEINHLDGFPKRYYGFCLNINRKKYFSDFA